MEVAKLLEEKEREFDDILAKRENERLKLVDELLREKERRQAYEELHRNCSVSHPLSRSQSNCF